VKHTFIFAALVAAVTATPARAQPVAADLLPAYEVATIVASMGMRPVGRPAWMRGRYVVAAIDRYGRQVNVVLDARDGQVLAVQPLGRDRFGAPPPGYGRPPPYDPMDGRAFPSGPRPEAFPNGPSADDDEFFDSDQQQGSVPQRAPARLATPPRAPSTTSVIRSAPPERKDAAPIPRPRPALARANAAATPPAKPAAAADAVGTPAVAQPDIARDAATTDRTKDVSKQPAESAPKPDATKAGTKAKPAAQAAKSTGRPELAKPEPAQTDAAKKPVTADRDIRVIDLGKPKDAVKPADKPGEAIRF
jgi:hypothetical protein